MPAVVLTVVSLPLADPGWAAAAAAAGALAAVLIALAPLVGRGGLLTAAALLLLIQAALVLQPGSIAAWWTIVWAVGIFGVLELGEMALERRRSAAGSVGSQWHRFGLLAVFIGLVSTGVVLVGLIPLERGILVQAAGVGALTVLAFGSAAAIRRRAEQRSG